METGKSMIVKLGIAYIEVSCSLKIKPPEKYFYVNQSVISVYVIKKFLVNIGCRSNCPKNLLHSHFEFDERSKLVCEFNVVLERSLSCELKSLQII